MKHFSNRLLVFCTLFVALWFLSCTKMNSDFYFNESGGTTTIEMDIDGNTLKVVSNGNTSDKPSHFNVGTEDECYVVDQIGILVSYHPKEKYVYIRTDKNTSGRHIKYIISGSKNGKVHSIIILQQ